MVGSGLGRIQNPVRGLFHGGAALAALAGLALLTTRARHDLRALAAASVFGVALLGMYTVSTVYHSIPWGELWKRRWQRIDHAMIYVLVAATFTPIAAASLEGRSLGIALGLVWGIALIGVLLKTLRRQVGTRLSVTLQVAMGWVALVWMPQVIDRLGVGAVYLIAVGGLFYMLGVGVFASRRPRLSPPSFSYHELFHLLVIGGSVFHFLAVLLYAVPAMI